MKNNNQISEKNIIHNYLSKLNDNKYESFNFKNDAAFLKVPKSKKIVVTNDTIVESVDFFKNDSPESIATKIATYNLSDISNISGGCHEISLIYNFHFFGKKLPPKNVRYLECPIPNF